jgi:uncharacterized membrane protein
VKPESSDSDNDDRASPDGESGDVLAERANDVLNIQTDTAERVLQMVMAHYHVGPMPDIEYIRGYSDLVPDAPERFLRRYELEGERRHDREARRIEIQWALSSRAQVIGAFLVLAVLASGVYLELHGVSPAWLTALLASSGLLGGSYAWSRWLDYLTARAKGEAEPASPDPPTAQTDDG